MPAGFWILLSLFQANATFQQPLKTSENLWMAMLMTYNSKPHFLNPLTNIVSIIRTMPPSYRTQSSNMACKPTNLFLYDSKIDCQN